MAVSKEQIQQIIGEGLTELAQQGVLDLGEISSIVNAISNPLIETFEAQAGLSGLPVRTFTDFNPLSDIVANVKHKVSKPLWTKIGTTGNASTLQNFYLNYNTNVGLHTSSTVPYYLNVYDEDPNSAASGGAEPNFAIAFGHKTGGGAYNNQNSAYTFKYPTRAIYAQYRGLLIGYSDPFFTFDGNDRDAIFVVNINRSRIKEKLDPGNWELRLQATGALSSSQNSLRLIDDSLQGMNPYGTVDSPQAGGRIFNIVSGTIDLPDDDPNFAVPVEEVGSRNVYGLVYPDLGILVLDPVKLGEYSPIANSFQMSYGSQSVDENSVNGNLNKFFEHMSSGSFFRARSEEEVTSTHYFCRIQNKDYNFSNNPSYFTASDGSFTNQAFYKDPKTYITSVGLYNENNELLAVAKLSKPLLKSFSKEAVIKVKLDF